MRYLMLVCTDPEPDPVAGGAADDIDAWVRFAGERHVLGERLRRPADATTVRVRGGETLRTGGPFTEGTGAIIGFDLLEAADLDEAVGIAERHPMARYGRLELRAFWPFED